MLKRFLLASAMLFVPLTTFAQNATTQVNGANLNGNPVTILTPWVPNGDGTYSQKVASAGGGSGSNAAAGPVNTTAPASASYTGFLSGANIVPVSTTNPLPISGTISATTTANATAAAPTYTSGSNPLSVDFAGNLRVAGAFYQATQPVSGSVGVSNFPATQAVSIATMPTTPVTGSVNIGTMPSVTISGTVPVSLAALPALATGANAIGSITNTSFGISGTVAVTGAYQTTQPVSGTVAVTGAYQATQPVSLATLPALAVGTNAIGSITNTAFGISGTLPAFAVIPTVNVGTMPSVAISGTVPVSLAALPALATGANAIGSITNTAFSISGTLPAFAATPTVNIGTMPTTTVTGTVAVTGAYQATQPVSGTVAVTGAYQATQPVSATSLPLPAGAATSALQTTINATLGTPFQAGGSVGITGTPAFKVSDTAGTGITSTTIAGKQRLDVTLAAGSVPGTAVSTIADQVGGVDSGGLLRALSVDTGGRVNVQGGNATAVKTDGSAVTQPISGAVTTANTTFFTDSTTALGVSITLTGTAHDSGIAPGTATQTTYYTATFYADQAGTAYVDGSIDNTTWYPVVAGTALVAATPLTLQAPVTMRYWRVRLVNGATAQTLLRVTSAFSGA